MGTPGRMLELIKQKKLKMHEVKTVVLDEGDQLLATEHTETVKQIIKSTLAGWQLVLFSATLPDPIVTLVKGFTNEAEMVSVKKDDTIDAEK